MKKFSITILAALWVSLSYAQIKVDSQGKIGLGTTNPTTDIDMSGNVKMSGNVTMNNNLSVAVPVNMNSSVLMTGNVNMTNDVILGGDVTMLGENAEIGFSQNFDLWSGNIDMTSPNFNINGLNIDIKGSNTLELWADNPSQAKITFQSSWDDYYLDILPSYAPVYFGSSSRRFQEIYSKTLNCYSLIQQSDINTKENIKSLEKSLDKLTRLNAISFDYKKEFYNSDSSSAKSDLKLKDKIDKERKSHFGFSAQEVQQLFPELVHEQENGLLGLNYVEFIPVIISGLKEQQTQINTLQQIVTAQEKEIVSLKKDVANLAGDKTLKKATTEPTVDESEIMLYQNAPNPFNHETEIRYYIPETIAKASIYVHDLNGGEIMVLPIENSGDGSVIIKGAELMKGMYTYTLVADDQIIDSKRMILTD